MADTGYSETILESPHTRPAAPRPAVLAAYTAIYVIWGTTYLAIRYAVETLPPLTMSGVRFVISGSILFAIARWRGAPRPTASNWRATSLIAFLFFLVSHGCLSWAEQRVPSGTAALVVATIPLWTALASWGLGYSRLTGQMLAGLALGLGGLVLLFGSGGAISAEILPAAGSVILLISALSWSVGSVIIRRLDMPSSAVLTSGMEMLIGGVMLCTAGAIAGDWGRLASHHVSMRSALAALYLIIFGSLVAYTAYVWLLQASTPSRVSTYAFVNPVIAVAAGWLLAGEVVTGPMIVAAGVIAAGVALLVTARH